MNNEEFALLVECCLNYGILLGIKQCEEIVVNNMPQEDAEKITEANIIDFSRLMWTQSKWSKI